MPARPQTRLELSLVVLREGEGEEGTPGRNKQASSSAPKPTNVKREREGEGRLGALSAWAYPCEEREREWEGRLGAFSTWAYPCEEREGEGHLSTWASRFCPTECWPTTVVWQKTGCECWPTEAVFSLNGHQSTCAYMQKYTTVGEDSHPIFCRTTSTVGQHSVRLNGPSDNTMSEKTHLTKESQEESAVMITTGLIKCTEWQYKA